jgi:para-nitrobenzyl esterase
VLGGRLGACHSLELPFAFDTLARRGRFTGTDRPRSLAERIGAKWTVLARHGTRGPDWRPYTGADPAILLVGDDYARTVTRAADVISAQFGS